MSDESNGSNRSNGSSKPNMWQWIAGGLSLALAALAMVTLWHANRESVRVGVFPSIPPPPPEPALIPVARADAPKQGTPPPSLPKALPLTREQKRFNRYDKDRDGVISRVEMMSTRSSSFRRLDSNGDNLLSFEEWAVKTSDRFASLDSDQSGDLSAEEFAASARK